MKFSPQQQTAISRINDWLKKGEEPIFRLFGYAGTGKTTLAMHLAEGQRRQPAFGAFSGKAAKVMRDKGCAGASTIHSMIYEAKQDEVTGLVKFKKSRRVVGSVDLVIIDECSMVGQEIGNDLLSFGKPILVLGDPAQLPPVGNDAGFFTGKDPDFLLDEVHRQAGDSNILRLATQIREGNMPSRVYDSADLTITKQVSVKTALAAGSLLVGKNATRSTYNSKIRKLKGIDNPMPIEGDVLICLKNDSDLGLFNGSMWRVHKMLKPRRSEGMVEIRMTIEDIDEPGYYVEVAVYDEFFRNPDAAKKIPWKALRGMQQFDFGYAITVHKSQGSQWDDVVVFDESTTFGADRFRWAYTAVTRAAKHLTFAL